MRSRKSQKLDLNESYPCPCRRRGLIQPIILTEAYGCNRCQQIFVLRDEGFCIEQLSNHYPYKRAWFWTGHQWVVNRPLSLHHYLLLLSITFIFIFIFLLLWATMPPGAGALLRWGGMLLLVLLWLMVLVWAIRR